jgi:4-aminobutyrate aminotransferase/(S)-3-amino-2-methylpropionate transaminase
VLGSLLPSIVTSVPGPRSSAFAEELSRVECPALTMRRARRAEKSGAPHDPLCWQEAHGANVRDVDGNVFVDLTAGFGAALLGHAHGPVVAAVSGQLARLVHALGDVHPSDTKVHLLQELAALAPFPARVILGLSGADAVEAALKTALLATGRPGVLAFEGGYHGLSHGPLAACGYGEGFRAPFAAQLNPHVSFAPYPVAPDEAARSLERVEAVLRGGTVGAVLVEPVQGRGGVRVPPPGFLAELARLAHAHGALLVADEIYTALGRTGSMLRSLDEGCDADLLCLGKALGNGLPVSACLGREEVMAAWGDPDHEAIHTSTFLGNPPACAAALTCLAEVRARDVPALARERGELLRKLLAPLGVGVRGAGLLLGVELGERSLAVGRQLLERGYLVLAAGAPPSVLCLTPPVSITDMQLAGFATALGACLREAS